jgi:ABC-type polysaccharide/polyol phosphate transport system ATPase subunit
MEAQNKLAVVVRNVGVEYDLRLSRQRTLKRTLSDLVTRRGPRKEVKFWALRDVSFAVKHGEVFGIIGANGAGKSTLMMTIAGVLPPDRGSVLTFGKTSVLFGLGTGFDLDSTGRENIYLNAAFLGISRKEIEPRIPEIADFCELGGFLDAPLRTYSSGMVARLGFAIAVNIEPEILLLDEVMGGGVGDAAFRAKSESKVHELMERAKAIVVVTHSIRYISEHCTKAIWLDRGTVAAAGNPEAVVEAYLRHTKEKRGAVRDVEPGPAVASGAVTATL